MESPVEQTGEDIRRLQRCVNDLVSLLSLPAMWAGGDPVLVVRTLVEALVSMLRLDFVYVRLTRVSETPIEMVQFLGRTSSADGSPDIGRLLRESLGHTTETWPSSGQIAVGGTALSVVVLRLGLQADVGIIVAGSHRPDFPGQTEKLVLSVAANEAAIGLQEAQLLSEQKRLADELDKRVKQRTRELAQTNEALQREIAERRRAEEALRARELSLRSLIDGIPGLVGILTRDGRVEAVNRRIVEYCGRTLEELRDWGTNGTIHAEDAPHVAEVLEKSIASGIPYEIEQRIRRFDGEYRWFSNRGVPDREASGGIVCWYVLLTDIDKRKRVESDLRRSEAFLAGAQRLSETGSFLWSPDTDTLTWSAELYRMFELDEGGITLAQVGSRVHADDRAIFRDMINEHR